jgi:hypothetical protein
MTTTTEVRRLVTELKPLISDAERGEFERAGWFAIADRLIEIQKLDPQLSQKAIGELVGKSGHWVGKLVRWRTNRDRGLPFADPAQPSKAGRAHAQQVLRSPTQRRSAFAGLSTEERVAAATDLLSEPAVAEGVVSPGSPARNVVKQAAEDDFVREARKRVREGKDRQAHRSLDAYFWSMLGQLTSYTDALRQMETELANLRPDRKAKALGNFERLRDECQRCINLLNDQPADGQALGDVIDSTATASRKAALELTA